MFGSGAFDYINVLNKAADVKVYRNEVISNNIANVDTPNYKRKDVLFEENLQRALENASDGMGSAATLKQKVANIDLNQAKEVTYICHSGLSYRQDGNNVDMATEQTELAANQIQYQALVDSMTQEFSRIRSVLGN
ncbi:MAG: flagellar basal body rod protein FlgB [Lachnospiraceae bacterium]|nr:flagellar basal body rod protein FlgB [Lachnospiraceae bacterium]